MPVSILEAVCQLPKLFQVVDVEVSVPEEKTAKGAEDASEDIARGTADRFS